VYSLPFESQGGFTQRRQVGKLSEGAQNDWTQLPRASPATGVHTSMVG
jgi:hypothetical protein